MTLVGLLADCPDRLEADLIRFYGVSLDDMRSGRRSVWSVASCVANMPRGGAVGEWFGGRLAVTAETEALWELTHVLAQVNSKKRVKPRPMPEGVRDVKARGDRAVAMAEKYRQKHRG